MFQKSWDVSDPLLSVQLTDSFSHSDYTLWSSICVAYIRALPCLFSCLGHYVFRYHVWSRQCRVLIIKFMSLGLMGHGIYIKYSHQNTLMSYAVFFVVSALWPSNDMATWRHRLGSTLVQVIDYCLTTGIVCLNRWWLIINEVLCNLPESNFKGSVQATVLYNEFEYYIILITSTSFMVN